MHPDAYEISSVWEAVLRQVYGLLHSLLLFPLAALASSTSSTSSTFVSDSTTAFTRCYTVGQLLKNPGWNIISYHP